ncbi:HlyD family secretion protein [Vibrio sp. SCSIO 43137]|uniref:HlyD family secretion protein n=1 Tax=Vibrio sp. SCSIO 43137 TaxID=3021011 RepID=UPI0023077697|nr:HlyD family efflux transporter periplasmic adaptor subunit [Vibrio sp. SCSIO 43137]WCE30495.1 HlyD family efflux transporter periplasmic adaptor subunit [Vibrio sp. SCSIO 43137]
MIFRKEVFKARVSRISGDVVLSNPISFYVAVFFILFIFSVVSIYLTQSTYSRKENVKGYLIPKKGLIKVYSERSGVIDKILVSEGDFVVKGQAIVKIRNSETLSTGIDLFIIISKEIKNQLRELEIELAINKKLSLEKLHQIEHQIIQKKDNLELLKKARATSNRKIKLKKEKLENETTLSKKGYLSKVQLNIAQEEYLDALESIDRLEIEINAVNIDISSLKSEMNSIPDQELLTLTGINRKKSELNAKLVDLNSRYNFIKIAPESGVVSAIQLDPGTRVNANSPILSIIPANSTLEIELLLPTKSAGFVKSGDPIQIRFDAFPYQKFGLARGEIISIDQALVLPSDKIFPIKFDEAMYRVRAKIFNQSVIAYGKKFPLKVGMIADVDIILEKRTLLEWLLDPIYSVKGKLG